MMAQNEATLDSAEAAALKSRVQKFYDISSEFYMAECGDHFHHGLFLSPTDPFPAATRNLTDAILDLARLPPGATVLDAGCGVGGMARHLARRHGCRVTGFSLSAAQVALARRDSLAAAAVAVDDTAAIPLGDRGGSVAFEALDVDHMGARFAGHAFDAVVAVEAFSHFPHKSAFFAAAAEVVAAQGEDGPERRCLLVLSDFFKADGLHQQAVDTFLGPLTRSGFIPPLASPGECEEMARRAGWVLVTKEDLTAKVAKTIDHMVKSESLPSRDEDMSALGQEPKAAMDAYAAIGKGYESGTMLYAVLCFEKVAAA